MGTLRRQARRRFDNIVWLIGGDRNPDTARGGCRCHRAGHQEFDKRHIFSAHRHPENSALDQNAQEGWVDFNTTYTYNIVHAMLIRDYQRTPATPFVLIESTYEGEHNASAVQSAARPIGRYSLARPDNSTAIAPSGFLILVGSRTQSRPPALRT